MCTVCTWCTESVGSLRVRVTEGCEPLCRYWELNQNCVQEPQVLSTMEPCLQSYLLSFNCFGLFLVTDMGGSYTFYMQPLFLLCDWQTFFPTFP